MTDSWDIECGVYDEGQPPDPDEKVQPGRCCPLPPTPTTTKERETVKSDTVIAALGAFMQGDVERGVNIIRQMEAQEISSGNQIVARRLNRLIDRPAMIRLPNAPESISLRHPQCDLNSLILSTDAMSQVSRFIAEWRHREALQNAGLLPRNVVFLHGPSGCGKTRLAEAIAKEIGMPFGFVLHSQLVDSHLGATSKEIDRVFKFLGQTPCLAFIDEADSILTTRSDTPDRSAGREANRIVNTLLMAFDNLPASSVVVMATNMSDCIDPALSRRIGLKLHLGKPTPDECVHMVDLMVSRFPVLKSSASTWRERASAAESFAEIEMIAMDAAREVVIRSTSTEVHSLLKEDRDGVHSVGGFFSEQFKD